MVAETTGFWQVTAEVFYVVPPHHVSLKGLRRISPCCLADIEEAEDGGEEVLSCTRCREKVADFLVVNEAGVQIWPLTHWRWKAPKAREPENTVSPRERRSR